MIKPFAGTILFVFAVFFCSCAVKKGCPSNGANVGAEKIISGEPSALKIYKKRKEIYYDKI